MLDFKYCPVLLKFLVICCLFVWTSGVTVTYSYTGAVQTFVVPANVYSLSIDMTGAAGGVPSGSSLTYGYGARIVTTITVTPLQTLNIYIGGKPADASTTSSNQAGGFNGGGTGYNGNSGGNGGGGGSDIRNGTSVSSRLVVAGGGGGVRGNCASTGGQGGLTGVTGCAPSSSGTPGGGATQSAGGAAGGGTATAGTLGQGGQCNLGSSCGGGGGGYYGGGGGSSAGGGGGSSYSSGTSTTVTAGYNSGSGSLTITYTPQPTSQPTTQPSRQPSRQPTCQPSLQPSSQPTGRPSVQPSSQPSSQPSMQPSHQPFNVPTMQPSTKPSRIPSSQPSGRPSAQPVSVPSNEPSCKPSGQPSAQPSKQPVSLPTGQPSDQPSKQPVSLPTGQPSDQPSRQPVSLPTGQPSAQPSRQPTTQPTTQPTVQPTAQPTKQPFNIPTLEPSAAPSTQPTRQPTSQPICAPSTHPSNQPSSRPTSWPSNVPTIQPTLQPAVLPSSQPFSQPSAKPSSRPSYQPTSIPTCQPSLYASSVPSSQPTADPTSQPTFNPSSFPSSVPSHQPTCVPTAQPTSQPSCLPTNQPTRQPSCRPSRHPSSQPSKTPSLPTSIPTSQPSRPTAAPQYISIGTLPSENLNVYSLMNSTFKIVLPFLNSNVRNSIGFSDVYVSSQTFGSNYVVFGGPSLTPNVNLSRNEYQKMFTISNISSFDFTSRSVSNLGDINGDGFDDLIIGVPFQSVCYVLFGTRQGFVNMTEGFTIFGASAGDALGFAVSGAGQMNADSYGDILIGAPYASNGTMSNVGVTYVIYGRRNGFTDVYLDALSPNQGYAIWGAASGDFSGLSVSNAGDFNGDGFGDVIIGASRASSFNAGGAFIVYGSRDIKSIDAISKTAGFSFVGGVYDFVGYSVSGVGDVNGDDLDDVVIGSLPQRSGEYVQQVSYLILGKRSGYSSMVTSSIQGVDGVVVLSGGGVVVTGLGDINKDGYDDFMLGSNYPFVGGGFVVPTSIHFVASPSAVPTAVPTKVPTTKPTAPSCAPSMPPSMLPTTRKPVRSPSRLPSVVPSFRPTAISSAPSTDVAPNITYQMVFPTSQPTISTDLPTSLPSSSSPTNVPTLKTLLPSEAPTTFAPSVKPTNTLVPTIRPNLEPFRRPTKVPSLPPTRSPSLIFQTELLNGDFAYVVLRDDNLNIVINSSVSLWIDASQTTGYSMYTIVPLTSAIQSFEGSTVEYTITQFNLDHDLINLELFPSLQAFEDLNITSGSVILTLSPLQVVRILGLNPSNMSSQHFVFAATNDDIVSDDGGSIADNKVIMIVLATVLPIVGFASAVYMGLSLYKHYKGSHAEIPEVFLPTFSVSTEHPELDQFDHIIINNDKVVDKHEAIGYLKKQVHIYSVHEMKNPLEGEIETLQQELLELTKRIEMRNKMLISELNNHLKQVDIDGSSDDDDEGDAGSMSPQHEYVKNVAGMALRSTHSHESSSECEEYKDDSDEDAQWQYLVNPGDFDGDYLSYIKDPV